MRWSTNSFRCDLYVYESAVGYNVVVASSRVNDDCPMVVADWSDPEAFLQQHDALREYLGRDDARVPIDHPEAGAHYVFNTLGEAIDTIERLRSEEFRIYEPALRVMKDELLEESLKREL